MLRTMWVVAILFSAVVFKTANAQSVTVNTENGAISSNTILYTNDKSGSVTAFLGIPFAAPPVGNLRFAPPQPPQAWSGVRDGNQYPAMCIQSPDPSSYTPLKQPTAEVSEDCLYLNVYTPSVSGKKLPVFVWFFGGKYIFGSGNYFEGTAFASLTDTVVVSINYRVGPLGFLYLRDESAAGNQGLKDQQAALRWVQANIANFGGDPTQVTIGGQSAGATSVSAQILAPSSASLFQRAITESSSIYVLFSHDIEANSRNFAVNRGCSQKKPADIVACLRAANASALITGFFDAAYTLGPVQDGEFLPASWVGAYQSGVFNHVPLLSGSTTNEGWFLYLIYFSSLTTANNLNMNSLQTNLQSFLASLYGDEGASILLPHVIDFYFKGHESQFSDTTFLIQTIEQICSDVQLIAPTYIANEYHSAGAPVFMYEWADADPRYSPPPTGYDFVSGHGAELLYTWGTPFLDSSRTDFSGTRALTDADLQLSKQAVQYWGNFVKTGNPNGWGLPIWPPLTPWNKQYLQFNCAGLSQESNFRLARNYFWTKALPAICDVCGFPS
jgi:carboxylesterase type B